MKKISSKCLICDKTKSVKQMTFISSDELDVSPGFVCSDHLESENIVSNAVDQKTYNELTNIDKVEIFSTGEIVKADSQDETLANFGVDSKQPDLLYVKFKMVHANTNKNKDNFSTEDLQSAEKTPILKLVNWEHSDKNIGVIYSSKYIVPENSDEAPYIECLAAISKFKHPEMAKEIVNRYDNGDLTFSMETWFKEVQCSSCNEVFTTKADGYCDHLKNRFAESSSVYRKLKGLNFAGVAIVANPADVQAEALLMASKSQGTENVQINKEEASLETFTKEQLDQMIKEAVDASKAELLASLSEIDGKLTASETEKQTIEAKLVEAETKISQLQAELEASIAALKSEQSASVKMYELSKIGYTVPDRIEKAEEYTQLFNKLKVIDDNAFSIIKELATKNAEKSDASTVVENVVENNNVIDIPVTSSIKEEKVENQVTDKLAIAKTLISKALSGSSKEAK